jgi:hypothetical protein
MLKVFIGHDPRQPISTNVLISSIYRQSSKPVAITPLVLEQLPIKRQGLTPFTYSRFLVPYLCNYEGWGLFLDADMLLTTDIAQLFELADDKYAAMVVKNQMKFEWASAILFNNAKCKVLTPGFIEAAPRLHDMSWLEDEEVGGLPLEWNHLVGYCKPTDNPSLIHYTQGVPAFPQTNDCEHADKWFLEHRNMNFASSWIHLMGNSVHATTLPDGTLVPKYKAEAMNAP